MTGRQPVTDQLSVSLDVCHKRLGWFSSSRDNLYLLSFTIINIVSMESGDKCHIYLPTNAVLQIYVYVETQHPPAFWLCQPHHKPSIFQLIPCNKFIIIP